MYHMHPTHTCVNRVRHEDNTHASHLALPGPICCKLQLILTPPLSSTENWAALCSTGLWVCVRAMPVLHTLSLRNLYLHMLHATSEDVPLAVLWDYSCLTCCWHQLWHEGGIEALCQHLKGLACCWFHKLPAACDRETAMQCTQGFRGMSLRGLQTLQGMQRWLGVTC